MTDTIALRALAGTLNDDLRLTGPWGWFGDTEYDPPYLATVGGGRRYVLGSDVRYWRSTPVEGFDDDIPTTVEEVDRYGAESLIDQSLTLAAQLVFPDPVAGETYTLMRRADQMPVFEVAPTATSADDPRVYRTTVRGVRNPVAEYLAAVDPTTVLGLLDRIAELEAQLAAQSLPTAA